MFRLIFLLKNVLGNIYLVEELPLKPVIFRWVLTLTAYFEMHLPIRRPITQMQKLKITANLLTPIVIGGGYMTFDALLASILFDQSGNVDQAHASVPVRSTEGLFHASAAIFTPIDQGRISFVGDMRADHNIDPALIRRKSDGSIHTHLGRTRRRDFGAVMNSYDTITTPTITWFLEGDAERISSLIENTIFVGKRRASGFGEVVGWDIDGGDSDGLLDVHGAPLRPIPVALFKGNASSLLVDAAWRPAYWHPANRAICYAPEMCA
jgi:hypothetical protein